MKVLVTVLVVVAVVLVIGVVLFARVVKQYSGGSPFPFRQGRRRTQARLPDDHHVRGRANVTRLITGDDSLAGCRVW
jgi:hypothetical protein